MAGTITLRAYLTDLKAILEHESPTEVVSHCRYILQHFPQNVETYRLLAQALLQRGHNEGLKEHFDEAAEVFRRVLSASPIDYVAHLGLSEIFEHEGELDRAIWHMERAYEQLPGNQMLQEALRELYARRDGEEHAPEKIQLTRAALARQYINGQLFDQALVELRTAMEQSPDRKDLQVLLAETLWESQHPIEAGEVAVQILKEMPANMTANRIMAQLWLANERPTDAQSFLDRLEALDPYIARELVQPDTGVTDPNTLTRLDYHGSMQASMSSETPDWVQSISEFDVSSNVQNPFEMPPEVDESEAFGGWAEQDEMPSTAPVPDWFSDDEPTDWDTPEESPDVPDWFSSMDSQKGLAEPADQAPLEANWLLDEDESPAAPGDESAAVSADWLFEDEDSGDALGETGQETVDASWLSEDEGVPDDQAEEQPALVEPVEVAGAWLADEPDAGTELDTAEQDVPGADWVTEQGDISPEGDAETASAPSSGFTDLLQGIEDQRSSPGSAADEEAESEPTPPDWLTAFESETDESDEAEESEPESNVPDLDELFSAGEFELSDEPTPEADLAGLFAEDDEYEEQPELTSASDWLAAPAQAEDASEDEEGDAFWAAFDPGESLPEQGIVSPEWLPDTGPLMSSETEDRRSDDRLTRGEAQDWLAGLEEVDEQALAEVVPVSDQPDEDDQETVDQHDQEPGEAAEMQAPQAAAEAEMIPDADDWFSDMESAADDDLLEMLAVSGEGEEGVSEHDEQADEEIERAEIPDWMQSAAPIDAGDESGEEAPVVELPEQPVMDEALMTLFEETQEDDSSAVDVLAQAEEPEIEALEPEPEAEQEVGWLEPETSEEDWLGSFTAAEAETEAIDESSAPVASEEDDWLASVPEPEIEAVSDLDEALSFDAVEQSIFESEELEPISEAVDSDEEIPAEAADLAAVAEDAVAVEASDTAEASDTVEVSDMVKDEVGGEEETAADDGPPAWLADMEPITAPEEDQEAIASLLDQPYDPFEGGSPDQVPQYASATDTGILQPDESPDWMSAFTGEELPEEEEPFLDEAEAVESGTEEQDVMSQDLEPDAEQPLEDVSESETDQEWEDEFPAPTDVLADYVYGEDELESMEEDDREMPDWLVAITSSESEQIEGLLPDEPETYSSAEDTGVLQPGNELDWLKDVSESAEESEETQAEEEAVDEARLWSDLDAAEVGEAGAESEDEDDFDFAMLETMAYEADKPEVAESESMEDETLASVVEGEGLPEIETDDELLQDLFAASGEQAALHEDEEAEEIEVAQPDDLEHTKVAVSEAEPVEVAEGESGKEPVPDDFTFYDLLPLWLRQPLERDPDAPMSADYEGASGRPEWLRDVSEDDEDTD